MRLFTATPRPANSNRSIWYFLRPCPQETAKSWLDLRYLEHFDEFEFRRRIKSRRIALGHSLDSKVLVEVLDCVAGAEDTTPPCQSSPRHLPLTI